MRRSLELAWTRPVNTLPRHKITLTLSSDRMPQMKKSLFYTLTSWKDFHGLCCPEAMSASMVPAAVSGNVETWGSGLSVVWVATGGHVNIWGPCYHQSQGRHPCLQQQEATLVFMVWVAARGHSDMNILYCYLRPCWLSMVHAGTMCILGSIVLL